MEKEMCMCNLVPPRGVHGEGCVNAKPNTQGDSWEQQIRDIADKDGWIHVRPETVIKVVTDLLSKERAAFGGCTYCYGKGYGSKTEFAGGRYYLQKLPTHVPCPKCERGRQFEEVLVQERAEGERRGAEKERERIFSDMTKYQFRYEITPDEIKNLRENLIHLDENMRRDGFYEMADRIFNDKMYRMGAPKSENLVKEYTVYVYKPHKNDTTLPADSTEV